MEKDFNLKTTKKKFKFITEKTNTGFSAYNKENLVFTSGGNAIELLQNAIEAMELCLEDDHIKVTSKNIQFEFDLKQFFNHYRVLNAKFLANRIGMNESLFSQYVNGHKKPSKKQTEKILDGIHEIGRELTEINLISA